jgi:rhodanese-related sulfurtransferase
MLKTAFKIILCLCAFAALYYGVVYAYEWLRDFGTADEEQGGIAMSAPNPNGDRRISPSQARAWMETNPEAVVLDVRTEEEFNAGHISGAVLLPLTLVEQGAGELIADKDVTILVYCRSGVRSQSAAQVLLAMGYANVYDFGGIIDWPYGTVP